MNSTLKRFNKAVKKLEEEKKAGTKVKPVFSHTPIATVTFDDPVNTGSVKTYSTAENQFIYEKTGKWPCELEMAEEDKILEKEAKLEDEKEKERESRGYSEKEKAISAKLFDDKLKETIIVPRTKEEIKEIMDRCDRYDVRKEPRENLEFDMYGTKPDTEAIYTDRLMTFEEFHDFGLEEGSMLASIKLDLLKEELEYGTYTGSTKRSELLETKRGWVRSLKKTSEELIYADGRLKKKLQTKLEAAEMNIERLNVELMDIWKEEIGGA
jgi:hypothetical protein